MAHVPALLFKENQFSSVQENLAEEKPLQICLNDWPYTMTMRTPGLEKELAMGLMHTEGFIQNSSNVEIIVSQDLVKVLVPTKDLHNIERVQQRNLISYSSCGLCGQKEFEEIHEDPLKREKIFCVAKVNDLFKIMEKKQKDFRSTGGTHSACAFNSSGESLAFAEDVGRHNSVDKVIGQLLIKNQISESRILLVSGRVSYEIALKSYRAGIGVLAAISAPTQMAQSFCEKFNMTLLGFCRDHRLTIYSHPEHLKERATDV